MSGSHPHPLLNGLIDYAGLFPPASLPLTEAVDDYRRQIEASHEWIVRRFIVPSARLEELAALVPEMPLRLIVLPPGGMDDMAEGAAEAQHAFDRAFGDRSDVALDAIELRSPPPLVDAPEHEVAVALTELATITTCPVFVEWPVAHRPHASVRRLSAIATVRTDHPHIGAKIRFGGASAGDYPAPEEAAAFLHRCIQLDIPFKATAGLHHPIRHARGGVIMHGFLNVFGCALLLAARGIDESVASTVLSETAHDAFDLSDGGFAWRGHSVTADEIARLRRDVAIGFGSCSIDEPVHDLHLLGWI